MGLEFDQKSWFYSNEITRVSLILIPGYGYQSCTRVPGYIPGYGRSSLIRFQMKMSQGGT